jgi:3-hydroxy-D-aspartate aldolase
MPVAHATPPPATPSPNEALIGRPGSRWSLATPALVLDRRRFRANLAAMVAIARGGGCALRPHMKGPKSAAVGRALVEAGAGGLACATLFEAECMVAGGIGDVLVTGPVVTGQGIARLADLAARAEVTAVVDRAEVVEALSRAFAGGGRALRLLVDLDVGQRRTGVAREEDAVRLAALIARSPGLELAGLQAYYGHLQGIVDHAPRARAAAGQQARISGLVAMLEREGLAPRVVSGGGTGTATIDAGAGVFTELQPGSFPFMDAAYEQVDIAGDGGTPFAVSLFVHTTVVSANQPDRVTIDAGMKALPTDGGPVRFVRGAPEGARYAIAGDEFGFVLLDGASGAAPAVGDQLVCVTPHCDTTVNLHAWLHVVEDDRLVAIWPIEARGRW